MLKDLREYIRVNKREVVLLSGGALFILIVSLFGLFVSGDESLHIPEDFDDSERRVSRLMTRSALALNDSVEELNKFKEEGFVLGASLNEQKKSLEDIQDDLQDMLIEVSVMSDSAHRVTPTALKEVSSDMARMALMASEFMVGAVTKLDQIFNNLGSEGIEAQDGLMNELNADLNTLNQVLRQYGLLIDRFNEILEVNEQPEDE